VLKVAVGVALLLIIALMGYRRTFTRLPIPIGARLIFLTGTEFILVGVALGDQLIGLLDEQTIRSLTPLFSLGLGVIGLIFGIQLELGKILRFPTRYLVMAFIQATFTMLVVFWPFYFILEGLFGGGQRSILLASLVLAATAACTAQTALALIDREFAPRGARVMELLRYISSVDALVGLLVLQFALCLMQTQPVLGFSAGFSFQWFALSLVVGGATRGSGAATRSFSSSSWGWRCSRAASPSPSSSLPCSSTRSWAWWWPTFQARRIGSSTSWRDWRSPSTSSS
jgi:hypothetical protein